VPVVDLADGLGPVQASRVQIEKTLVNLLRNGVDAMRAAGVNPQTITIAARTAPEGGLAQVTVQDGGPGLNEEGSPPRITRLFTRTKPKGIGMGCPISRSLVEDNGGRLWSSRRPGAGGIFHFNTSVRPMNDAPTVYVVTTTLRCATASRCCSDTAGLLSCGNLRWRGAFLTAYAPGRAGCLVLDVQMPRNEWP